MAVMKKSTRKKLSKQLNKLIKKHGPEMALALVTGIVSALASDRDSSPPKKVKKDRDARTVKVVKVAKPSRELARPPVRTPVKPLVIRKRA